MARKKGPEPGTPEYERHKDAAAARQEAISRRGRDIGSIPPIADPERRAVCGESFELFCKTYFPELFYLPWSDDHRKVLDRSQTTVCKGGKFAIAMPRGGGKTVICQCACLYAVLYGYRQFVCLIASEEGLAKKMLQGIKSDIETNELLAADFPEVCYPVSRLEGIANRCKGQLCNGVRTHISWTDKSIVLPTIDGSKASGAIIRAVGITGSIRGMNHKRLDGKVVRPDLVVVDDPQTDESARIPGQCEDRRDILSRAIVGLAGPTTSISVIMPCTVICPGDLSDTMLDRTKNPEWHGERLKMVYEWPENEKLWEQYGEIRAEDLRSGGDGSKATEFYRQNRAEMNRGAVVAWPERFRPGEISAIQCAWNLRLDDEAAFFAEYNNEPLTGRNDGVVVLTADQISEKLNRLPRYAIPLQATHVTAMIDVGASVLWYAVCAWAEDFTGWVVDYGSWPDQGLAWFTSSDVRRTLQTAFPGAGQEGCIHQGLERLTAEILGKPWLRDDDKEMRIERCLVDANWGEQRDTVYNFCRTSQFAATILPSHGRGIGVTGRPMSEWRKQEGDRTGLHWRISGGQGPREVRHVTIDVNYWKSFVHDHLAMTHGDRGSLSLFGERPVIHRLFSQHLVAERRTRVTEEGSGRQVDVWKDKAEKPDNHWFDCCVGAAVAASIQGVQLKIVEEKPKPSKPRKTLGELMKAKPGIRRIG